MLGRLRGLLGTSRRVRAVLEAWRHSSFRLVVWMGLLVAAVVSCQVAAYNLDAPVVTWEVPMETDDPVMAGGRINAQTKRCNLTDGPVRVSSTRRLVDEQRGLIYSIGPTENDLPPGCSVMTGNGVVPAHAWSGPHHVESTARVPGRLPGLTFRMTVWTETFQVIGREE